MQNTAGRIQKLRRALRKTGADAMLVTNFLNVTYLTGFSGDDSYLLVSPKELIILSDPRYTTQLEEECPDLKMEIRPQGVSMLDSLSGVIRKAKVGKLAVEGDSLTVSLRDQIAEKLPKTELVPTSGIVEELRLIKDKDEIARTRLAVEYAERAFAVIRAGLRPDQTELQVANELEYQIRKFGGSGCSFPPIVAVGPRAALPHARPTDRKIGESDFVLIDWGAVGQHYMSDLTRVLVTGTISPKLRKIYGVVLKAQLAGIAAIKPGATMHEVDTAARSVITKAGYGKQFGHGLGHGTGLEIHEAPRLSPNQHRPLETGMIITVEPGIYIPGWGGVRIEDDVLVTRSGHEVLTSVPKEFDACVLS